MTAKQKLFIKLYSADKSITAVCKEMSISRGAFYQWKLKNNDFKDKVEDIKEEQLDFVEDALMNKIKEGDTTSIIFYLKTQGKGRGYNEKMEVDNNLIVVVE